MVSIARRVCGIECSKALTPGSEDSTENKALYGKDISNKEIVSGDVAVPDIAKSFIAALSKY